MFAAFGKGMEHLGLFDRNTSTVSYLLNRPENVEVESYGKRYTHEQLVNIILNRVWGEDVWLTYLAVWGGVNIYVRHEISGDLEQFWGPDFKEYLEDGQWKLYQPRNVSQYNIYLTYTGLHYDHLRPV